MNISNSIGHSAGDERSSRNPAVLAKAHKQHVANAAEWLRRARAFDCTTAPEGADYDTIVAAYRRECKLANIDTVL
jgi:hypothetical protein